MERLRCDGHADPAVRDRQAPRARRHLLGFTLVGLLACGVVAALAWSWQWRIHPDTFPGDGNKLTVPLPAGEDMVTVGVTYRPEGSDIVTIHAATPRVIRNTADARFEFYVCTLPADGSVVLGLNGRRAFDQNCLEPVPVNDGTPLDTSATAGQQPVMVAHLSRPGIARRGASTSPTRTGTSEAPKP